MAERLVHRGPDEDGLWIGDGAGLSFRRLRIIDLHTGSQPMTNEDGAVRVVFNGEIYNHVELRARLEARGHRFESRADTEVLVHLYEEMGPELVTELNGMFAFAIWDERAHRLTLARDPIGIKPLLYALTESGLVFGSEMGSLLEAGGFDTSFDPDAVHLYLSWGAVPAPRTIYRGVRRLEPGHLMVWENGRASLRRYWHALEAPDSPPTTFEEGAERLRELLEDSVRRQLGSDVPLGAFLSGGIDSTTLVGLMARREPDVRTFSVGFSADPAFDETPWAREAAAFHRTRHRETQLGPDDVRDVVPLVLDRISEPFGSSSILPSYVVSRETRRELTVALSGDGADELFAGYDKYLGETYRDWYGRVPRGLRRRVVEPAIAALPASRDTRLGELGRKARRFLGGFDRDAATRHDRWMRTATAAEVRALVGDPQPGNPGIDVIRKLHGDYEARGGRDALNRVLFTDLSLALPTDMLVKVDQASMLNSLEVRVPFLDHRIVALAMAMPGEWKMRGTRRKRVLREAVRDLLPPAISRRPKAGFEVPVGEWLKREMAEMFWDTVSGSGAIPFDRATLERWYDEHRSGRADRAKILWAVFSLRWWERRLERTRTPGPTRSQPLEVAP
jgi:asparagine synthase (glutamine-hydrolysing)